MTESHTVSTADWAGIVAQGYADAAAPPLTPELLETVRETLRGAGLAVTLIETAPRILSRVAAPETADYFRAELAADG